MPYKEHVRATAHFILGPDSTHVEEATCTTNFTPQGGTVTWVGINQDLADDMYADWAAWVGNADAQVSSDVKLDHLKLYKIGTDGRAVDEVIISAGDPVRGVMTTKHHPWQCSIVTTLVASGLGKGKFGRIYLPPQGVTMTADGLIDNDERNAIFTTVHTLLTALSDRPGIDASFGLAIAGRTGVAGTLRPVTELRMGRVMDTQRRRRRSLPEAYASSDFSA